MKHSKPELREITLIDPSYQPCKPELEQDLQVNATFEELTAAVVRPVKIRYAKPQRKRYLAAFWVLSYMVPFADGNTVAG